MLLLQTGACRSLQQHAAPSVVITSAVQQPDNNPGQHLYTANIKTIQRYALYLVNKLYNTKTLNYNENHNFVGVLSAIIMNKKEIRFDKKQ